MSELVRLSSWMTAEAGIDLGAEAGSAAVVGAGAAGRIEGGRGVGSAVGGVVGEASGSYGENFNAKGRVVEGGTFVYLESLLVLALGVSVKAAKQVRKKSLKKGGEWADWELVNHQVAYSAQGLDKLLLGLGIQALTPADLLDLQKKGRGGAPAGPLVSPAPGRPVADEEPAQEARVERHLMNRFILTARLVAKPQETVEVWIKRHRDYFTRGMVIPIRPRSGSHLWDLARAYPRHRGRW